MKSKGFEGMVCPIAGALGVIGDRWGFLILRDLVFGISRYEDFRQSSGVTNATLSDRLKLLETHGLVERQRYQIKPERFEYVLTPKGWDVAPLMPMLAQLGDKWGVSGATASPLAFTNRVTGSAVRSGLVDQETNERLDPSEVVVREGPGADDLMRWRLGMAHGPDIDGRARPSGQEPQA